MVPCDYTCTRPHAVPCHGLCNVDRAGIGTFQKRTCQPSWPTVQPLALLPPHQRSDPQYLTLRTHRIRTPLVMDTTVAVLDPTLLPVHARHRRKATGGKRSTVREL